MTDRMCFFFSSRRRHTRCLSDWSSDVCSSDLPLRLALTSVGLALVLLSVCLFGNATAQAKPEGEMRWALYVTLSPVWFRSEERRVGKACRSRWSPYQ